MTITEALELARDASDAYNTAVAFRDVTHVPWRTIAADLASSADHLSGAGAMEDLVRKLRDRAEDARYRARRSARITLTVEVVL